LIDDAQECVNRGQGDVSGSWFVHDPLSAASNRHAIETHRLFAPTVVVVSGRALIREKTRSQPLSRIGTVQPGDTRDASVD
jgi:hypothetical protein